MYYILYTAHDISEEVGGVVHVYLKYSVIIVAAYVITSVRVREKNLEWGTNENVRTYYNTEETKIILRRRPTTTTTRWYYAATESSNVNADRPRVCVRTLTTHEFNMYECIIIIRRRRRTTISISRY